MVRWNRRLLPFVLMTLVASSVASAELTKLDPRARTALQRLRAAGSARAAMMEQLEPNQIAANRSGELDVIIRGNVSRAELEAAGARVRSAFKGFFTAFIPIEAVDRVAALPGVTRIGGSAPVELELDASVPTTGANLLRGAGPTFTGINGSGVLVGDVDSGVDYGHLDFVNDATGTTRFASIWDQTNVTGPPPPGFGYGTNWLPPQITSGAATEVDVSGHGTHVMGIAGGDGSGTGGGVPAFTYAGMAPRADLVMVKTDFQTTSIVDGVNYVFDRATALGKNAVCNLSLGSHFGPHDGTSDFEAALSALTGPGRIIVKSAGNERGLSRHAEANAAGTGTVIQMNVTGSAISRTVAIDGYYNATESMLVKITTPETAGAPGDSTVIGPIPFGGFNAPFPGQATADGVVYVENGFFTTTTGAAEIYIEITPSGAGQSMNGLWKITLIPVTIGADNGQVDLWRFFAANGVTATFALGNQNDELVSEPGNAVELITVAADVSKQNWIACNGTGSTFGPPGPGNLATFSSPGPTRDGRLKPDIAAPGIAIGSTNSFDFAFPCPGAGQPSTLLSDGLQHVVNAGTSMAAPHVTGAVALLLQKRGALSVAAVKSYLTSHALVDAFTGATPNNDWGHGKLQVGDLVDPTVAVTAPNGGEAWQVGSTHNITWSATDALGSVANVDIQLSRTGAGGPFEDIAIATANTGTYSWAVNGTSTAGATAFMKVTAHDTNANSAADQSNAGFTIPPPAGVEDEGIHEFALSRIAPNPTTDRSVFEFTLPRVAKIKLSVVDVQGRIVARVAEGSYHAGRFHAEWDGMRSGQRAAAGLYFVRYEAPGTKIVRRLVLTH